MRQYFTAALLLALLGATVASAGIKYSSVDISSAEWNVTDFQAGTTQINATAWNIEGTYDFDLPAPTETVDVYVTADLVVDLAGPGDPPILLDIEFADVYLGTWDGFDTADFVPTFNETIPLPDIVLDPNTTLTNLMLDAFVDFDNGAASGAFGANASASFGLWEQGAVATSVVAPPTSLDIVAGILRGGDPDNDNSISGSGSGSIRIAFVPEPAALVLLGIGGVLLRSRR